MRVNAQYYNDKIMSFSERDNRHIKSFVIYTHHNYYVLVRFETYLSGLHFIT